VIRAHLTEYIVIIFYLLFMSAVGILFRKYISNFSDYFRSGCKGSWWLVGASIFMASFSAWTFTGAAGVAYISGLSVMIIFLANTFGYLINFLFTAHLFRQIRAITFPEVIKARFDTLTQQIYVWFGAIPGILSASLTLLGVAIFTSSVFGFNLQVVIIVLGTVVLLYATIGGSWSVMATDFLQTLILMPLAVLMMFICLRSIGGIDNLLYEVEAQNLPNLLKIFDTKGETPYSIMWALAMFSFVFVTYNSFGSAVKFFATKDGNEAKKAALLAALLMLLGSVIWFIPPIVARLQFSELVEAQNIAKPAEASYAVAAIKLLPNGLAGLIVVAMFSATMSSLDTILNQFAAIITQDVFQGIIKKDASPRLLFILGQIVSVLVGLMIILAALYFSKSPGLGIFEYMLKFGSLFGTPMVVPMCLSLFIKKTPPWAALYSISASLIISFMSAIENWSYQATVFTIILVGSIAFIATIPFWKYSSDAYKERVRRFYKTMHTPVNFEDEVGKAIDDKQLKIVGSISFIIGIFITLLVVLPNPWDGRIQILSIGGIMAGLGLVLLYFARLKQRKMSQETSLQ